MNTSPHELGRVQGANRGPTLVLIGGMHGNEPAGVTAARAVVERLQADSMTSSRLTGELVALQANLPALAARQRYLTRDLNRQWTAERVVAARASVAAGDPDAELGALVALAAELDAILARARGPVYVLDLHTTSAEGIPFAIVGAADADRDFAAAFGLTGIMGLEIALEGVLSAYLATRGCVALSIEGGQHESAAAVAHLEAAATVALCAAGLLTPSLLPAAHEARRLLERTRGELPALIAVTHRHHVDAEHQFRMEPGFATIQRVAAGTLLARHQAGEIRAPFDGVVLLPLYQAKGSDGFFFGREVREAGEITPRTA